VFSRIAVEAELQRHLSRVGCKSVMDAFQAMQKRADSPETKLERSPATSGIISFTHIFLSVQVGLGFSKNHSSIYVSSEKHRVA
jgi:hypothetical protein